METIKSNICGNVEYTLKVQSRDYIIAIMQTSKIIETTFNF